MPFSSTSSGKFMDTLLLSRAFSPCSHSEIIALNFVYDLRAAPGPSGLGAHAHTHVPACLASHASSRCVCDRAGPSPVARFPHMEFTDTQVKPCVMSVFQLPAETIALQTLPRQSRFFRAELSASYSLNHKISPWKQRRFALSLTNWSLAISTALEGSPPKIPTGRRQL
ncbi:hypothetical protein RRG08_043431 [Elysia crispata]|uniref:Uncharacterized protein n=1 Tax=Elysia crispata TaxID=231223 RepID=A0AAE0YLD8_9GAST|nr:hypothetical protein RRG08_043431 [Elysia crispata]